MEGLKQTSILSHFSGNKGDNTKGIHPRCGENVGVGPLKVKSAKPSLKDTANQQRISLKTIQPTSQDGDLTRGATTQQKAKSGKPQKIHTCKKAISVYEDPAPASTSHDEYTQTDTEKCWCQCHEEEELSPEDEAFQLMGQEEITETYWKELAEQRREALRESLDENEVLNRSISELREENRRLSEMAEQADKLASFLKEVACDDSDDNEEQEEGDKEKDNVAEKEIVRESPETVEKEDLPEESPQTGDDTNDEKTEEKVEEISKEDESSGSEK